MTHPIAGGRARELSFTDRINTAVRLSRESLEDGHVVELLLDGKCPLSEEERDILDAAWRLGGAPAVQRLVFEWMKPPRRLDWTGVWAFDGHGSAPAWGMVPGLPPDGPVRQGWRGEKVTP